MLMRDIAIDMRCAGHIPAVNCSCSFQYCWWKSYRIRSPYRHLLLYRCQILVTFTVLHTCVAENLKCIN